MSATPEPDSGLISIQMTLGEARHVLGMWASHLPRLIAAGKCSENSPARKEVFALLCASNGLQVALYEAAKQGLTQDDQSILFTTFKTDVPQNVTPMNPSAN